MEDASLDPQEVEDLERNLHVLGAILTPGEVTDLSRGILLCFMPGRAGQFATDCPEEVKSVIRKLTGRPPVSKSVIR